MPNKVVPHEGDTPEQTIQGAPGANIRVPEGVYRIYTYIDNEMLVDMSLREDPPRTHNVKLYQDNAAPESTWRFIFNIYDEVYQISNGLRNDLAFTATDDDSLVAQPIVGPIWIQQWIFKDAGAGFVYIENLNGKVMDVRGANTGNNTDILLWPYGGTRNQKFRLVKIRDL